MPFPRIEEAFGARFQFTRVPAQCYRRYAQSKAAQEQFAATRRQSTTAGTAVTGGNARYWRGQSLTDTVRYASTGEWRLKTVAMLNRR